MDIHNLIFKRSLFIAVGFEQGTATACYSLLTFSDKPPFNLETLSILFSSIYKSNIAFDGLLRQWTLSTDPRINLLSMDVEIALVHILEVFKEMWKYIVTLIHIVNQKKDDILKRISVDFPKYAATGVGQYLSECLCVRNRDVLNNLQLSPKTVIKYLKQLEEGQVLTSAKSGREVFYFNNTLVYVLSQQVYEV